MKLYHLGCFSLALLAAGACSKGTVIIGTGGAGGSGAGEGGGGGATTSTTSSSSSSSSSGSGGCVMAADCAALTDACNTGACVNGMCGKLAANEFGACDDGKNCSQNDICQQGVCVGGSPKFCPSDDSCHLGSCDLATDACIQIPGNDGASCDDNDACTLSGTCNGGACQPGGMVDCSFLDGTCSTGVCDSGLGCLVKPQNDGTPCDDNLFCTIGDICTAGQCAGVPNTCAPPGDVCLIGTCNEAMKSCVAVPGNNGTQCNDGNLCTTGETCANGLCKNGVPTNNGMQCDDGDGCTLSTTCSNGICGNPGGMVVQCIAGDKCCPANCGGNDSDCLFWQGGVLQNVSPATLTGWTQCYSDTYDVNLQGSLAGLLQQCSKGKLLMACAPVNAANYTLVAMGLRPDVLFECGSDPACTHIANNVGWYFNNNWSWGFVKAGDPVQRNECDVAAGPLRLCWHTVNGAGGYRCGDAAGLNGDSTWKRYVYQAD
ncbi:MAG: hypothetical protein ABI193_14110 [Minicystis sp.]